MSTALKCMLGSKKFLASVLASLVGYFGFKNGLTQEQIAFLIAPLMAYTVGQSLADLGKEAAKINKPPTS